MWSCAAGSDLNDDDDDRSLPDIPEGDEDIEAPPAKRQQRSGQLDAESNGHAPVAMPDNYPEEWKKKFTDGYQQTAENIDKVETSGPNRRATRDRAGPPAGPTPDRRADGDTGTALPHADSSTSGGVGAKHVTADEAAEDDQLRQKRVKGPKRTVTAEQHSYSIMDDGMENGQPDSRRRTSDSECSVISPFARAGAGPPDLERAPTVVSLSQIDPEVLADERGSQPVPIGFERAESEESEHDYMTYGADGVPTMGLMQAGMNEPSGALGAPSELSLQHTTYSGKVHSISSMSVHTLFMYHSLVLVVRLV